MNLGLKWISLAILFLTVNCIEAQLDEFDQDGLLIVRLQSDRNKINYLKSKATNEKVKAQLATVQKERAAYNQMVIDNFEQFYDYSKVVYMYDTATTYLKNGDRQGIFFDKNLNAIQSDPLEDNSYLIVGENTTTASPKGLVVFNQDFSEVDHPQLDFVKLNTFFIVSDERIFGLAVKKLNRRFQRYLPVK